MDNDEYLLKLRSFDDIIPPDDYSRFIVRFVDYFSQFVEIEKTEGKVGRPEYNVFDMMKLLLYAYSDNVTSSKVIAKNSKFNLIYRYVSNGIEPSERTIRRFIQYKGHLFNLFLGLSLFFADSLDLTDFEYLAIDGTIKKANNNKYNVLNRETINLLRNHFCGMELSEEEINNLSYPARKFIERKDLNVECKLDLLDELNTQLTFSGQNTVPVNDVEARWVHNKKGLSEIGYNVQTAVDTKSKLICGVKVSQNPTDHYELPKIVEQAIDNIGSQPEYISADTAYHTKISFEYLKNHEIQGLIPDRRKTREKTGRLSKNPFHKDHFKYNYEKDVFTCPNNQELKFSYTYIENKDLNKDNPKIRRIYTNYNACKDCEDKHECYKGTHRQICEYIDQYALEMREKMNTEEFNEMFKKRSSTVEAPFGTLKFNFHMDNLPINGVKHIEDILTLFATTYNLKIMYHKLIKEIHESDDIKLFKEKMEILLNLNCKIKKVN